LPGDDPAKANGTTPIHAAATHGYAQLIELLDLALKRGHGELVDLLKDLGALAVSACLTWVASAGITQV